MITNTPTTIARAKKEGMSERSLYMIFNHLNPRAMPPAWMNVVMIMSAEPIRI
jgi:hypothetical protein